MFVFEYDHTSYQDLLQALATVLQVPVNNDRIDYPARVADGYAQRIRMHGEVQAMLFNYTLNDDYRLHRKKIKEEFYTLWFIEIAADNQVQVELDDDRYTASNPVFSTALLTSSLFDAYYDLSKGSSVRGINILLDNQWLSTHLGVEAGSGLLHKYLALKSSRITVEPLDIEYKKLMQEVIDLVNSAGQFNQMAAQNRIMLLIERFFMRMAVKMDTDAKPFALTPEDIHRVMEVESLITRDVFTPAPFIPELARMVNISETKLKNNFKTVYGLPIYQYFQKARMRAAREVLEKHTASIKQVARELGYTNLSNFSTAFRKEFGVLPSELK